MMQSTNVVNLVARLGADPEVRAVGEQNKASLRVCVVSSRKDDKPNWVNVTAWGKTADFVKDYLKKGMLVSVAGSLRNDEYEKDGAKQRFSYVNAEAFHILSGKNESAEGVALSPPPEQVAAPAKPRRATKPSVDEFTPDEDELPPF